jgi:hypothetical protein
MTVGPDVIEKRITPGTINYQYPLAKFILGPK